MSPTHGYSSGRVAGALAMALLFGSASSMGQSPDDAIDRYAERVDQLISSEQFEQARRELAQARASQLFDERLVILERRLQLLESLNSAPPPLASGSDQQSATLLAGSLQRAVESRQLSQVTQLSELSARSLALLNALYAQYSALTVAVTTPVADLTGNGYTFTLEIVELRTSAGDIAYPAPAWSTHRIQLSQSSSDTLTALW